MKQTTLGGLRKRSAPDESSIASKRVHVIDIDDEGTAADPIDLDGVEDQGSDRKPSGSVTSSADVTVAFKSKASVLPAPSSSADPGPPRHDGPSTARPLRINPPSFDLSSCFTHVKPKVVKKEPDLDLLYFKTLIKGKQLFEYLLNELPWYRVTYQTRGITIRTPRWTCVWGCDDTIPELRLPRTRSSLVQYHRYSQI